MIENCLCYCRISIYLNPSTQSVAARYAQSQEALRHSQLAMEMVLKYLPKCCCTVPDFEISMSNTPIRSAILLRGTAIPKRRRRYSIAICLRVEFVVTKSSTRIGMYFFTSVNVDPQLPIAPLILNKSSIELVRKQSMHTSHERTLPSTREYRITHTLPKRHPLHFRPHERVSQASKCRHGQPVSYHERHGYCVPPLNQISLLSQLLLVNSQIFVQSVSKSRMDGGVFSSNYGSCTGKVDGSAF